MRSIQKKKYTYKLTYIYDILKNIYIYFLQVFVDMAVDENGLWAIMAMAENNNTLVLKVVHGD